MSIPDSNFTDDVVQRNAIVLEHDLFLTLNFPNRYSKPLIFSLKTFGRIGFITKSSACVIFIALYENFDIVNQASPVITSLFVLRNIVPLPLIGYSRCRRADQKKK